MAGEPVLPVTLKYDATNINPAWTIINEPLHLVHRPTPSHTSHCMIYVIQLRLLCQFRNRVEVTFLEPYYPTDAEKYDATIYAEDVRMLMVQTAIITVVLAMRVDVG